MKVLKLSALVLLAAAVAYAGEQPEFVTKEVTGEAAIVKGNKAAAEAEAVKAALRSAVEQAAGVYITSDTATSNSTLLFDRVYANAQGYVKKYDVLSKKEEGGVLHVTVKAEVGTSSLSKDVVAAQQLVKTMGKRKVVVLVNEQTETIKGNTHTSDTTAYALTKALQTDGWTIIDPAFAAGKVTVNAAIGPGQAREVAKLLAADYIIYGTVGMTQQKSDSSFGLDNFFPVSGSYDLNVFMTDTGEVITKVAGKFVTNHKDVGGKVIMGIIPARATVGYPETAKAILEGRSRQIVSEIRDPMLEKLRSERVNGNRLQFAVATDDLDVVLAVQTALLGIDGITADSDPRLENGTGSFHVFYAGGSSAELANKLRGQMLKNAKKRVKVTGLTPNKVSVALH